MNSPDFGEALHPSWLNGAKFGFNLTWRMAYAALVLVEKIAPQELNVARVARPGRVARSDWLLLHATF
jgi:hypothetical protein